MWSVGFRGSALSLWWHRIPLGNRFFQAYNSRMNLTKEINVDICFYIGHVLSQTLVRSGSNEEVDETSMYTNHKQIDPKNRYNQTDVKSRDEIKNF
jgi:hypothetical protein